MIFNQVKTGMFFYRKDRGYMMYVSNRSSRNIESYVYDIDRTEFMIDSFNNDRWIKTIWVNEEEAKNKNYMSEEMIKGLFLAGKVKNEF